MSSGDKTIGIVGLGIMGGAFAKNLVAAGFHVVGFDIDPVARRAARKAGAELGADAAAVARAAPVIITSLPNPAALHATVAEVVAAKLPKRTIIEASTFTLADKLAAGEALTHAGHIALDCPVSGTGAQAKVKDLVIYASGEARAIAKLKPVFLGIGRAVHDLGAYGNGSRMKYVANLLVAIHNVASAEAMVLGIKSGLDPKQIFELVKAGAGNSRVFELRAPMMVADRYDEASMKIKVWQKDLAVIGEHAAQLGCPTPLMSATLPIYAAAMSMGHAAHDTAAVCAVLEEMAGVKRKQGARQRKSKVAVSARTAAGSR
jgi:3-hydroxyisobutyrate dehydrogenase-like beta-hydroxyacid dehydrogenase